MSVLLIMATLVILAAASQWLAWRLKLPAILLLLVIGILIGPVFGLLQPNKLFGPLLFPGISLAVAVILFEGSLSLKFSELGKLGHVVRRMVSIGTLSSWLIFAVATHWITGFIWPVSILFGAVIVVSGPTVIAPILRAARPNAQVRNVLLWESILIDPIGALLAVLVFSGVIANHGNSGLWTAVELFFGTVAIGLGLGCGAGFGVGWLLSQRAISDYPHGIVALGTVFMVFAAANSLVAESGLLAVTIMGIWLANMREVPTEHILNFKESLSILLISLLFLLLAARLQLSALVDVLPWGLALYLVIQMVAQPLKLLLAYDRHEALNWRERALSAWIAPRGIVAAAGAPVYADKLASLGYPDVQFFVPLTFAVIIITVLSASFTTRPLARLLRVAETAPRGVLIIGANPFAIGVAEQLQQWDFQPLLVDDDFQQIRAARMRGLATFFGSPVSEAADREIDLVGFGYLLALSTDDDRNLIAGLRYTPEFGHNAVFSLADGSHHEKSARRRMARRHRKLLLFAPEATAEHLLERLDAGWSLKITKLSEQFGWEQYRQQFAELGFLPLFLLRGKRLLPFVASLPEDSIVPAAGDQIMALIGPGKGETDSR
jgi:NhaP-type Na+/H+ or K+/H+ antiporter